MIAIKEATKRFLDTNVLDSITLNIERGDKIALMGPNGAGKTTLVRTILGFYHLDRGEVRVEGFDPVRDRVEVLRRTSFIPQTPPPIKLSLSELMEYVSKSSHITPQSIIQEASRMDLDISKHLAKPFFKLSGGMKQKMLIAIALAKKSDLLIFDEPTANLDPKAREKFYALLQELPGSATTIYVTHRIEEVEPLVNRKIYMDLGKVIEDERV